jgi:hypothetical protein
MAGSSEKGSKKGLDKTGTYGHFCRDPHQIYQDRHKNKTSTYSKESGKSPYHNSQNKNRPYGDTPALHGRETDHRRDRYRPDPPGDPCFDLAVRSPCTEGFIDHIRTYREKKYKVNNAHIQVKLTYYMTSYTVLDITGKRGKDPHSSPDTRNSSEKKGKGQSVVHVSLPEMPNRSGKGCQYHLSQTAAYCHVVGNTEKHIEQGGEEKSSAYSEQSGQDTYYKPQ